MRRHVIFLLGLLLCLPSCNSINTQSLSDMTPYITESTPFLSATAAITEPSRFAKYTTIFGEGSLQYALTGISFDTLTEHDKDAIISVMRSLGGDAIITEDTITITQDGQSAVFYADKTTVLIDADGNAGGTRWIESPLSALLTPIDACEIAMCLSKRDTFAVKYKCDDAAVYDEYCAALNGWTVISQSDMVLTAEHTDERLGHCALTVSFSDNVLTIFIQQSPAQVAGYLFICYRASSSVRGVSSMPFSSISDAG